MRILHVCNHFNPCIGGIEKYVEDLCNNLIKSGHTSDVVCLDKCPYSDSKLIFHEKIGGINVYRLPFINIAKPYYQITPKVLRFVKNYDIIHVHGIGFFSDILTLTKIFHKKPLILSTHGGIFHTKKIKLMKNFYFNFWCRFIMKFVDKVIAHSKNDERLFSKISKPVLIPYSINFDDFSAKKTADKNTFLYIGRLSKNKRVDRLLEVASYLKKRIPNFRFYIVGDGNERPMLEKKCKDLDLTKNVQFVGEKTGKPLLEYYFRSRFFLSASEYEGFGISVIEAMASGCIVIINDIESFRNFVKNDENGFIIGFSKPKESSELILKIIDNKNLSKISDNAKKTAKEYDWKELIKKIENVYKTYKK